jgi:hypothetical protein
MEQNSDISPHLIGQLIFEKNSENPQGGKNSFLYKSGWEN